MPFFSTNNKLLLSETRMACLKVYTQTCMNIVRPRKISPANVKLHTKGVMIDWYNFVR
jgi:hypothetical protein